MDESIKFCVGLDTHKDKQDSTTPPCGFTATPPP